MDAEASNICIGCSSSRNMASDESLGGLTSVHKRSDSIGVGRVEQGLRGDHHHHYHHHHHHYLGQGAEEAHEGAKQSKSPHPEYLQVMMGARRQ